MLVIHSLIELKNRLQESLHEEAFTEESCKKYIKIRGVCMIKAKRVVNFLISVLLVISMIPTIAFAEKGDDVAESTRAVTTGTMRAGTWFETAYATWAGKSASGYRAYVRTLGAYDWRNNSPIAGWLEVWKEVDAQLVRKVDPARNIWRVDIPGLPRGEYEIQVRATDGTTVLHTFTELETWSFPRNGAAFVPSNVNTFEGSHNFALNGAVGGYLPDGREDPSAKIIYVTHENMGKPFHRMYFQQIEDLLQMREHHLSFAS